MTNESTLFSPYSPCAGKQKIKVVNGFFFFQPLHIKAQLCCLHLDIDDLIAVRKSYRSFTKHTM